MSALVKADMCDARGHVFFTLESDIMRHMGCPIRAKSEPRASYFSFLPMRIATIAAPIGFSNIRNESLRVIMFGFERSN